ncbi:Hypothetical predicted protein [Cloeon dipterum]|uniref:Peptidase S1 domain-containing protein n=1 Tax=Cloeon dipterum TaxID=197152 RepID=A0A8S1C4U7_9INSE|nr:Hypothetical predicted protein [Cloeon dipterum]
MRFLLALVIVFACNCAALEDAKSNQQIVFQNKDEHIFEVRSTTSATTQASSDVSSTSSQSQQESTTTGRPSTPQQPLLDRKNQTADRLGNEGNKNCNCIRIDQCPLVGTRIVTPESNCTEKNFVLCCSKPKPPKHSAVTCGIRPDSITLPADEAPQPGQAPYGYYPWVVALLDAETNVYLGGGVLLNNVHVLTAAHKIYTVDNSSNPERIKVRLGEWDARNHREPYRPIDRNVTEIIVHPEFNAKNLKGDVAILTMEEVVPLRQNPHIGSACLPAATSNFVGQRCWVSGWGKDAFEPMGKLQEVMKHVDVPVIDPDECETRLRDTKLSQHFQLDKQSFLCAGGEPQKDACTGDGGSPLVCESTTTQGQFYVAGLVAWGIGCATPGLPGVYVNVAGYSDWIREVTANFRNLEY